MNMFDNCSGMTGEVNGHVLWQSQTITYNSANCFNNCVGLDNFNLIPNTWGGLNKTETMFENEETFIFEIKIPNEFFKDDKYTVKLPLAEYYIDETNELNENIIDLPEKVIVNKDFNFNDFKQNIFLLVTIVIISFEILLEDYLRDNELINKYNMLLNNIENVFK